MDMGLDGARSRWTRGCEDSLPSGLYGWGDAVVGVIGVLATPCLGASRLAVSCVVFIGLGVIGLFPESLFLVKFDIKDVTTGCWVSRDTWDTLDTFRSPGKLTSMTTTHLAG